MLYRLRCPRCGATEDHAFVRPGAVTVCASCHTIWRIEPAQVQRLAEARADTPPTPAAVEPDPPPRPASSGDSSVDASPDDTSIVGLSGLSEVMRNPGDPVPDDDDAALATGQAASPPSPKQFRQQQAEALARNRASEAAAKRRSRTTLVLLATLTVMVGSLGIAVALLATKPQIPAGPGTDTDPNPSTENALNQATETPAAPVFPATRLELRDPRLLNEARPGVRAVVELLPTDPTHQLEPNQIAVRTSATGLVTETLPGPITLLLTASDDGRLTAAWQLTDPRDLTPFKDNRLIAELDAFPDTADPDGWIVTALHADSTQAEP